MESGGDGISLEEIEMSRSFSERVILPVFTRLGSLLGSATPDRFLKRAAQRLARSGFHRTDPRVYIGTKVMLALTCAAVFIVLGGYAKLTGSRNLSGISDPVVDALIEKIVGAQSRAELTFACRALDRVLRAGHYWIPQWNKASHWIAYWDVFAHPKEKPRYGRAIPETWWRARAD